MPLLVLTLVVAVLAGFWLRPPAAFAVTGALAALTVVSFVWSVADGKGDEPWWIVVIALAGAALAFGIVRTLTHVRAGRQVSA